MAKQISSVDYWMKSASRKPLLSPDETIELSRIIQDPNSSEKKRTKAINKLIEHNLRFVITYVKHWVSSKSSIKWDSEETCDLLQLGALGLRRAAEKYDYTRGYRFTTYAYNWIRQAIGRYTMESRSTIRIPEHAHRQVINYRLEKDKSKAVVTDTLLCAIKALDCTSYDIPTGESENNLLDVIADTKETVIDKADTVEFLMNLAKLEDHTKDMLRDHYIIGTPLPKVAEKIGISCSEICKRIRLAQAMMRVASCYNRQVPVTH
jgi:RNA polymerase sigma factor (sigma-70 family)